MGSVSLLIGRQGLYSPLKYFITRVLICYWGHVMNYAKIVVFLFVLGFFHTASAQGVSLNMDTGLSVVTNDIGALGVGLNVSPGYRIALGKQSIIVPEMNLGFRFWHASSSSSGYYNAPSASVSLFMLPIYAGARYVLKVGQHFEPYVAMHMGAAYFRASLAEGRNGNTTDSFSFAITRFGLNVGGGLQYALRKDLGLGGGIIFDTIFTPMQNISSVSFAVNVNYNFL